MISIVCVKTKILMSGDVELNPGPLSHRITCDAEISPSGSILELRLHQFGLKPLDVGGGGDCCFRALSHQLYGDPNSHSIIRIICQFYRAYYCRRGEFLQEQHAMFIGHTDEFHHL